MQSTDVRSKLIEALQLDLVGPTGNLGDPREALFQAPSRWYLTGFLVPTEAGESQKADPTSNDELDQAAEPAGIDDSSTPEKSSARGSYLPSSMGMSLLLPKSTNVLMATVRYGEYLRTKTDEGQESSSIEWRRVPREETIRIELGEKLPNKGEVLVPNSRGVEVVWSIRKVPDPGITGGLPDGAKSISVFLVNKKAPAPDETSDEGFIFQAELELKSEEGFLDRPDFRSMESNDWDERVADLQYRDTCEFSVGHSVATAATVTDGSCHKVTTCWIPDAEVERVAPAKISGVELKMEVLADLKMEAMQNQS